MATIKDVALEAGVSIGTVSNYLNRKTNISEKTAKKITEAIQKLNYVVQSSGRELRQGKINVLGVIFPNISEPYFEKVISSIKGYMDLHGSRYSIEIALTDHNPEKEETVLLNYIGRNVSGIILYSCQPGRQEIFQKLENSKIPYVLIDRRPKKLDCNFIYMDNYALFYKVVKHYCEAGYKDIALITGPLEYDENQYALDGYRDALGVSGVPLREEYLYHCKMIRENGFRAGIHFLQDTRQIPNILLTTSYRLAEGIRYAYAWNHLNLKDDMKLITTGDSLHDVFYFDESIKKTYRSAYEVGEKSSRILLENMESPIVFEKQQYCIQDTFDPGSLEYPKGKHLKGNEYSFRDCIRVLLLDDENAISGMSSLLVDFYEKTRIRVEIVRVLPEHMFDYIEEYHKSGRDDIDVFLIDISWRPYMAESGYLLCLEELAQRHSLEREGFIPHALEHYGEYKGKLYALPFMVCTQLLFYRRDVFQDEYLVRKFEEQNMIPLRPPVSWAKYNTIARFFTRSFNPDSPVEYGHSMSVSYPEELICNLMPRLWEQKGDLYSEEGYIQCDTRQVERAVCNLLEGLKYAVPDELGQRPISTLNHFIEGKTAMVNVYYNYATGIQDWVKSKVTDKFGYTHLPGNPVLSGWSLALSRHTKKAESAFQFIQWASGMEISVPHTILGGQSPKLSVYQNYDLVTLYPWLPKGLQEMENARLRRAPISRNGGILSEKLVETKIYQHLRPLMEQTVRGQSVDREQVAQVLRDMQRDMMQL